MHNPNYSKMAILCQLEINTCMKTLRDYINLIEAAESEFKPTKSKVWSRSSLIGTGNDTKGSMQIATYDQNVAGQHRFTTLSQTDDDDEGMFNQRTLPASTNLQWVANEEELEEASREAID
jgi:hypothetical protein